MNYDVIIIGAGPGDIAGEKVKTCIGCKSCSKGHPFGCPFSVYQVNAEF